ncbi:tripeptidyl-peptidase [Aureococcus anophagefferens]|nr:tripeptidyl-peptidase [Aureococcus anophagefferens]
MDCRRTLLTDFDARGDAAEDADAAAAALEFFVECEIDHFGDENHCKAFALELAAAYARARRRAAARAGLGDDAATLRPISAAASAASLPRTCSSSSLPADGGYAEEKRGDP